MSISIIRKIDERVALSKEESDTAYFFNLLYAAEQLTKLYACVLVSLLNDDKEKHKYTQLYNLVRADGIGDWSKSIEEILLGPASHFLGQNGNIVRKELTQKCKKGSWQYDSVESLKNCMTEIGEDVDDLLEVTQLKNWFALFTRLRNKSRGHGALPSSKLHSAALYVEKAVKLIHNNSCLFDYEWAYLHQNLSGKYKVTQISPTTHFFDHLKSTKSENYRNGVYIYIDKIVKIELLESDSDTTDFFFPNGGFNQKRYEVLSYITGEKETKDGTIYLLPPGELPPSETEGFKSLEVVGNSFTNLPKVQSLYIKRGELESELKKVLLDDRHPMITLVGAGGIGKTSLALSVLKDICHEQKFNLVLWFSARDIDLLEEGAKPVKPDVLDELDISKDFVRMVDPNLLTSKNFKPKAFFEQELGNSSNGPTLIVLDNFETVKNPSELFLWLDTYVRLPNKILITTRFREFKADYPIAVSGMIQKEFEELARSVAVRLDINHLLTREYLNELYNESGGHPYVAKILLGEIAKEGKLGTIRRIVASQDEILTALFERTYQGLSQPAKRVFLTLTNWRSAIPLVGLEAVLKREENELIDVEMAVDELYRTSFIELLKSNKDQSIFVSLPLSAMLFGKKKLSVSPMKYAIEGDTHILLLFGPSSNSSIVDGVKPRFDTFFKGVAKRINNRNGEKLSFYTPILKFICRKHPDSWISLANLLEENSDIDGTIDALQSYLETSENEETKIKVWKRLSELYRRIHDHKAEAHCLLELSIIPATTFTTVSNSASRINAIIKEQGLSQNQEDRHNIVKRIYDILKARMENEKEKADDDDYSNLAWLCVHLKEINEAKKIIRGVLKKNPNHVYSLKLAKTINM